MEVATVPWDGVSLLTVNTNGIKKNGHLLIENLLVKHSLSCVQETKLRDAHHFSTLQFNHSSRFQHRLFVNDPNASATVTQANRSGGVLTVLRSDFPGYDSAQELSQLSVPGRYLVVKVVVNRAPIYIHNVYAPVDNQEKVVFFNHLPVDFFEDGSSHIVLGDLNTPLDPSVDASDPRASVSSGGSACNGWLGRLGVVDAWRIHHPDERVFTGPQPRRNRLDYVLMSNEFCGAVYGDSKYFEPKGAGDHLAHSVTLRSMAQPHGHGYWRFSVGLLDYPDVVEAIRGEVKALLAKLRTALNPGKVWMRWKGDMRGLLQALQRKLRAQYENALRAAKATLDAAAGRYREERNEAAQAAFQTALKAYHDCIDTSRAYNQDSAFDFHANNTEMSSKFFFRPLDTSLRRVSVEEVRMPDGSLSTNPADISGRFRTHWGTIFGDASAGGDPVAPLDEAACARLLATIDRTVSTADQEVLNAPILASDFAMAIKKMRATSAPGMDGFPAAFYQVAADDFGACLEIVFTYQLERGELLPCQRQSAITLLHKKGSRSDPGNYRPIALMNVDVKALSKVLTSRLQPFLSSLVHPDQKAFVKGRMLHHHVRFMSDLQDLVTRLDDEAYAMFLDFEKAYDRVNWSYLTRVLTAMGCGGSFSQWVQLLYKRPRAHLLLNGYIQGPLEPTRGLKQGDPLSVVLFLLVIEPLGNLLRSHDEYGIPLSPDVTVGSVFFADDSTLLASSIVNILAQLELVDVYCRGSGAKLNKNKCVLMSLHRTRVCPRMEGVHVLGQAETVSYLGILFGQQVTDSLILDNLDRRFYEGFQSWFRRARTLQGRLLIAQTMVLSRLWHYTAHVFVPVSTLRRWQAALHRFVLSRRYQREARHFQLIPNEFLHRSRGEGGLRIPLLKALVERQALSQLMQFIAAADESTCNWTTPGKLLLQMAIPEWGPRRPLDFLSVSPWRHGHSIARNSVSAWWKGVWRLWYSIKWPVTWKDLPAGERLSYALSQPIWFTSNRVLQYARPRRTGDAPAESRCLAMIAEPQRSFRRHFANAFQVRSLHGFFTADGHWATRVDFAERHIDYTLTGVTPYEQFKWLQVLHKEASQVFQRVARLCEVDPTASLTATDPSPLLYFGVRTNNTVRTVPRIPKSQLLKLVQPTVEKEKTHPIRLHDATATDEEVKRFVSLRKRLRGLLLPIYEDLQFRLAFRLLPVRARFSFMTSTNPDIIYCVRDGCDAVETERHLFFECSLATALWDTLGRDWGVFFRQRPRWIDIALGRLPPVQLRWEGHTEEVGDMWHVIRSVVLHTIWTDRNRCLFNNRTPLPAIPALRTVYTVFSAHVRACFRRRYDQVQQESLKAVLDGLRETRNMGAFMRENPGLSKVRFLA